MDHSYSDNDISKSPSQLLERLQMLRQLQLLQRGKLQKQRLQYQETSENYETSSCVTEIISHFSNSNNSTSYNTFQSLLQSPQSTETTRLSTSEISQKVKDRDLIDGVSVLNLSQESEFIESSPASTNRAPSKNEVMSSDTILAKKQISLDEMPILSPRKDFEMLVLEKLQMEKNMKAKSPNKSNIFNNKKQFLKRGQGMARFGVKKKDLVIQNTTALPWRRKNFEARPVESPVEVKSTQINNKKKKKLDVEILETDHKLALKSRTEPKPTADKFMKEQLSNDCRRPRTETNNNSKEPIEPETSIINIENKVPDIIIQMPKGKHPMLAAKGKTWAAVLSKEQSDFLTKLKQSEYYKNFASPAKSTVSDISCDENASELRHEKETAEQNLFELLENKVSRESFNLESSFFNRILRSSFECSGESTPLVMQKCLADNPNLMHIFPEMNRKQKNSYNETEHETECCSDTCSSVSSCCSCKTIEPATPQDCNKNKKVDAKKKKVSNEGDDTKHQSDTDKETEVMKANMAEMNAKLIITSELLKERLQELEDEIETFRKENVNLNKLREGVDMERQKFYEDKNNFEQKFNEEKILSEYYLADEKEKLNKQKQMYERYVREMRGRLNKKEKDEVVKLKQEISNLKEEIRIKDAKSTSTIARLRNQIKIMEKEKNDFHTEVEKLKKENRRIQHSNDITRRLTNMKYLEQINKKLSNMNKTTHSEVELSADTKYKAFEIERQSRSRTVHAFNKNTIRPRAKSVPNLKVTSRYAKYFSQKDAVSETNNTVNLERLDNDSDTDILENDINSDDNVSNELNTSETEENNLEKIYMETFRPNSPKQSNMKKSNGYNNSGDFSNNTNNFFLRKSNSTSSRDSKSPSISISQTSLNRSKSPVSVVSHSSNHMSSHNIGSNSHRSKSPAVLSNHSSLRSGTVIPNDAYRDKLMSVSPEPSSSKTSLTKTSLNPTEIRKSDGSRELRFPNGNVKYISADGKYSKFVYYNGDVKENFLSDGRIKYYYAETKTYHTTYADGLEVLEFSE